MRKQPAVVLLALILLLGGALRVGNLGGQPFWRDEAWVASAVRDLPLDRLAFQTHLPLSPLFAATVKIFGALPIPAEWSYRLPAALSGLLVSLAAYAAARAMSAPRGLALVAAALCATSLSLVVWSRELKAYSAEALISSLAAALIFGIRHNKSPVRQIRLGLALGALATIGPWYAYGGTIVLAAMIPRLILTRSESATPQRRIGILALGALAASTIALYFLVAGAQADSAALRAYMSAWFIDAGDPRSWLRAGMYLGLSLSLSLLSPEWIRPDLSGASIFVAIFGTCGVLGLIVAGLFTWPARTRGDLLWWLLAPLAVTLVAAIFHRYPFGQIRMMQYWVPACVVCIAAGVYGITRWLARLTSLRRIAFPAAVAVAALPATYVADETLHHTHFVHHDVPAILRALAAERAPGELVVVDGMTAACVSYYAPQLDQPLQMAQSTAGTLPIPGSDFVADVCERARFGRSRFWWVTTDEPGNADRNSLLARLRNARYNIRSVRKAGGIGSANGAAELLCVER